MNEGKIRLATDQRPFAMVYHDFLESSLLNGHEKWIYVVLKRFANSEGKCFPSIEKLAALSGMSVSTVKRSIQGLEEKHVLKKEQRFREDGGKSSNLYTLYDRQELWQAKTSEEAEAVVKQQNIEAAIKLLQSNGYSVQTKELAADTVEGSATSSNGFDQLDIVKTTVNYTDSDNQRQDERYSLAEIKEQFQYDAVVQEVGSEDADAVFSILYDALNSHKKTIRVGGEERPAIVVMGRLMGLEENDIVFVVKKFHEQSDRIKNPQAYILTQLYNAHEQNYLDLMNQGHHKGDF